MHVKEEQMLKRVRLVASVLAFVCMTAGSISGQPTPDVSPHPADASTGLPGAVPSSPGAAPASPGAAPSSAGAAPLSPGAAPSSRGSAQSNVAGASDAAYAGIAKRYFADGFRESPSSATGTGVHDYDARLDDVSAAHFARHFRRDALVLRRLQAIDPAQLSPEVAVDHTMLVHAIEDDLLVNQEGELWRHNSDMYVALSSGSIYGLIERRFAPAAVRLRDAIARENAIPLMLSQARSNLTSVDPATKTVSGLDAKGAAAFFATDVPTAFAGVGDAKARSAFRASTARATAAMQAFAAYLSAIKPSGTYAIGRSAYERRLAYEDALPITVAAYLAVGRTAWRNDRARFIATARAIDPKASPMAVYGTLARQHPAPSALLAAASDDLKRLRAFVQRKRIVTLPADADISVVATPKFERSFISAQEDPPGVLERVATKAYYNVTPADPAWPHARQEDFLAQFNDYERPLISGHEVYPGHFVNYTIDKHLNLSLTRRLLWNSEFGEGWAHYGEQMMVDEGWGNGDPHVRLAQLSEALLRECRLIVGAQLHTGGWTVARSERFFRDECFQTPAVATEESLRGTQDPMYGYYTLGKLMIFKLRDDYRKKLGPAYTLQKFHDALLAHGDPPVPLVRPLLLGPRDDGKSL